MCHSERTNGKAARDWLQRGRLFGALDQSEQRFLQIGFFLGRGKERVQLFTFYRPDTQRADVSARVACDLPVPERIMMTQQSLKKTRLCPTQMKTFGPPLQNKTFYRLINQIYSFQAINFGKTAFIVTCIKYVC